MLLVAQVWHDISYWNSDFSSICPMFTVRNINRMERAYLTLLQYNTIISASQYAQYYFSLRHTVRVPSPPPQAPAAAGGASRPEEGEGGLSASSSRSTGGGAAGGAAGSQNFRAKYLMQLHVGATARIQEQSAALAQAKHSSAASLFGMAAAAANAPPPHGGMHNSQSLQEVSAPAVMPQQSSTSQPSAAQAVPQRTQDRDIFPPTYLSTSV